MCGIAGVIYKDGRAPDAAALKAMGELINHRGPDFTGIEIRKNAGFVHKRLSILDLSPAGNQPYKNERYILCFNGEIYNYLFLKEKLTKEGASFHSSSDTAVLFELLVRFGVEPTLRQIRGMFAFSFYDRQAQTLYLCRDRFGIKPLVWKEDANGIYWGSEAKALAPVTVVMPDPIKTLFSMASIGEHSSEYTVFEGIKQLPPASYLEVIPGQSPKITQYYDPAQEVQKEYHQDLMSRSQDSILEIFEKLMNESVSSMLMSDAPMGIFVSGGVDSSLIAAIAKKFNPEIQLFTANILGKYSEFKDAQKLSQHICLTLHDKPFVAKDFIKNLADSTWHYECPIVTHTNAVPFRSVAQLAREKSVKAVLTGEGSDELFLGYPGLHYNRFRPYAAFPLEILKFIYGIVPPLKKLVFGKEGGQNVNDFLGLAVQGFERQIKRKDDMAAFSFLPDSQAKEQHLSIQMLKEGLLALLHRNDRMGMAASIESRFPFLDEEVVRFAVNLPVKWKRRFSFYSNNYKHPFLIDKAIVRSLAVKYLPESLSMKRKEGFPMYGHQHLHVSKGYFKGGYVEAVLGLTQHVQDYMIQTQNPYYIAKLVSVDIFGRLYAMKEPPSDVTRHLSQFVSMH